MGKQFLQTLGKAALCVWALGIVILQIILYGPSEFSSLLQRFLPQILEIKAWLEPFLTAQYRG